MEILRGVLPKDIVSRTRDASLRIGAALALATALRSVTPLPVAADSDPQLDVTVSCSNRPAYGLNDIGPHAVIYVNAAHLNSIATRLQGGTWLYVRREYSGSTDPNDASGYRIVGYSSDPDSFTANMDGYMNSIRNQDQSPDGQNPFKFNPGDVIGIMVRRGAFTERTPVTEYLISTVVPIPNCAEQR